MEENKKKSETYGKKLNGQTNKIKHHIISKKKGKIKQRRKKLIKEWVRK